MTARIRAVLAGRDRHFPRVVKGTRHLETCRRALWLGDRERWTNEDGAGWGAPCSEHCRQDRAAWDALAAWVDEHTVRQLELVS